MGGVCSCCSSVCRGPSNSGMRLLALRFWLLLSPVLGRCLEPVAAPFACPSAHVSALGVGSPSGGASATGSSGQQEHSIESPALSVTAGNRLMGRCPSQIRSIVGVGLHPLPALLIWLAHPTLPRVRESVIHPPPPCWSSWRWWWSLWT